MPDFPWLTEAATSELADLGKRIASCIKKHGYDERSWLMNSLRRQIAQTGVGRMTMTFSCAPDGTWFDAGWRPA